MRVFLKPHRFVLVLILISFVGGVFSAIELRPLLFDGGRFTFSLIEKTSCSMDSAYTRFFSCIFQTPTVAYLKLFSEPLPLVSARLYYLSFYLFLAVMFAFGQRLVRSSVDQIFVFGVWILSVFPATVFLFNSINEVLCLVPPLYFLMAKEKDPKTLRKENLIILSLVGLMMFSHQYVLFIFASLFILNYFDWKKKFYSVLLAFGIFVSLIRFFWTLFDESSPVKNSLYDFWGQLKSVFSGDDLILTQVFLALVSIFLLAATRRRKHLVIGALFALALSVLIFPDSAPLRAYYRIEGYKFKNWTVFILIFLILWHRWMQQGKKGLSTSASKVILAVLMYFQALFLILDYQVTKDFYLANRIIEEHLARSSPGCSYVKEDNLLPITSYGGSALVATILLKNSWEIDRLIYFRGGTDLLSPERFRPCEELSWGTLPYSLRPGEKKGKKYWRLAVGKTKGPERGLGSRFHVHYGVLKSGL